MDRNQFLDWAEAMLALQLGVGQVIRQVNNVQHGFVDDVSVGIVANAQTPEVRVHLYSYGAARRGAWQAAAPQFIAAPYALPLAFRVGDSGNVWYLEFSSAVATPNDFERWRAPVFGYIAFFVAASNQQLIP